MPFQILEKNISGLSSKPLRAASVQAGTSSSL
jgi:hypothetical protein